VTYFVMVTIVDGCGGGIGGGGGGGGGGVSCNDSSSCDELS
jgi:hypothetical protein